jgi:hypothetical protein
MLTEIALNRKQFRTICDLKDGVLLIAYREGNRICISTTGSNMLYAWENERWVRYKPAPKRAKFGP